MKPMEPREVVIGQLALGAPVLDLGKKPYADLSKCCICGSVYHGKAKGFQRRYCESEECQRKKKRRWYENGRKRKGKMAGDPTKYPAECLICSRAILKTNHHHKKFCGSSCRTFSYYIKGAYGLTTDDYRQMFVLQGGCCAACGLPFTGRPHLDHCHKTGRARGLLHPQCNLALGMLEESPLKLRGLADYAERWQKGLG